MPSSLRIARTAGIFYLICLIAGFLSEFLGRPAVLVSGNAAATAGKIAANADAFRWGFATNLIYMTAWMLTALALYALLRRFGPSAGLAMVTLTAVSVSILCVGMLAYAGAMLISNHSLYGTALGASGADALTLLFLEMHRIGYFVAQIFFSLWLVPLGYLMYRSGWFPRALSVLVMAVCLTDLAEPVLAFVFPGLGTDITSLFIVPGGVAEISLIAWLLLVGVNSAGRLVGAEPAPEAQLVAA